MFGDSILLWKTHRLYKRHYYKKKKQLIHHELILNYYRMKQYYIFYIISQNNYICNIKFLDFEIGVTCTRDKKRDYPFF